MAVDTRRIQAFIGASTLRRQIAETFTRAGFEIVWVTEEDRGSRWGFYLKLPSRLRSVFGTGREVLVWVVQSSEFQARTVTQAMAIIERERPRLCEDFAIVITNDPNTELHTAETDETLDTIFLGFSASDFSLFEPWGGADFVRALQQRLYSRDLYDLQTAAKRSEDFFGRRSMVTEIATRLRSGGRHVGLFGLRKIGKTSFLYRLQSILKNSDNCIVAHVEIERIDAINPSAEYLLWSLGEAIFDSHRHVRNTAGLLLFGQFRLFSLIDDPSNIFELFDHDLRKVLAGVKRQVVLMFDEIELLAPDKAGSQWGSAFVRVWRLLRGLDQQIPQRLSYFVTSTNPSMFEQNRVGDIENPVYNYLSVQYLKPLTEDDVSNLIRTLGSRMGMQWQEEAINRVFEATGGHPALVRALASLVHKSLPQRSTQASVRLIDVNRSVERFLTEKASLLSQLVAVLSEQYPDEFHLMKLLAEGKIGEFREFAEAFPEDVAHLQGYGLCSDISTAVALDLELLHTFVQRQSRPRPDVDSGDPRVSIGETISGYRVEAAVGARGGFARVYKATRSDGSIVAIKVFANSSLGVLQREVEPLQEIDHPSVVSVYDFGKSERGFVYMIMEYLEGSTLRHFCSRSTRASTTQVRTWLNQLLEAFDSFHPDDARIRRLRGKAELSMRELADLDEARHGFIHRDVKPENVIITSRGAVLIDFNISSRAAARVVTTSFTPGYMPPDGVGHIWTADLDLYQLGLSMMQALLGTTCDYEGGVRDLRQQAKEQLNNDIGKILLRMTAPDQRTRFGSAPQVLAALQRLNA